MSLNLGFTDTVRFLELYSQERLLYDTTHVHYRNRRLRSAATQRVAQQLAVPGFGPLEVTFKFKNLRNSYSQELKKMEESDAYYPKVHWFALMNSFLEPFIYTRPALVSNHVAAARPETDEESRSSSQHDGGGASRHQWPASPSDDPEDHLQVDLDEFIPVSSVKKRRVEEDQSVNDMSDSGVSAQDTYDHFGRYISSLLRELGPPESLELQQEVTSLVLTRIRATSYIKQEPRH